MSLEEELAHLRTDLQRLQAENAALKTALAAAEQRIAELEAKKTPPPVAGVRALTGTPYHRRLTMTRPSRCTSSCWLAGLLFLLTCLLLTACGSSTPTPHPPDPVAAQMASFLTKEVQTHQFMGAVLIEKDGKTLLSQGYGLADFAQHVSNTAHTRFRIGSLTKPFTAMAIVMLQEQGKLTVHDPICRFIQDCPTDWQPITIQEVLTHTSGIPNYTSFPDYQATKTHPVTPDQLIARFKDKPLDFAPGAKYSYSNSGYVVLGRIIELASGEGYAAFLQEHIFTPLHMNDTGYDVNHPTLPAHATGYYIWGARAADVEGDLDMSVPFAAGALYSTVEDLERWDQALYTTRLVAQASLDELFTPAVPLCGPGQQTCPSGIAESGYGYGWDISTESNGREVVYHTGLIDGFTGAILRYPQTKSAIILLSNLEFADLQTVTGSLERMLSGDKRALKGHVLGSKPGRVLLTGAEGSWHGSLPASRHRCQRTREIG